MYELCKSLTLLLVDSDIDIFGFLTTVFYVD